jgi:hypothetical protein
MKIIFGFILLSHLLQAQAQTEQATFMDIAQCPLNSAKLALELKIEPTKIHSCTSSFEGLYETPDKIEVVNLSYDDPTTCTPTCLYKTYSAVVEVDGANVRFSEVPAKDSVDFSVKTLPTYGLRSTRRDFSCQSYNIEELLKRSYGRKYSDWGLFIELKSPFICSWTEDTGTKTKGQWTGVYFAKKLTTLQPSNDIKYLETKQ